MAESTIRPAVELVFPGRQDTSFRPRLALGLLIGLAATKLLAHLLASAFTPYGFHRDEFLYFAMGEHLEFWRMDFPLAIAVLSEITRGLFGDSLFAIRLLPALAGTAIVVLTGLLAREFGGGRFAQGLAMAAVLLCALFLRPAALFQPVVFDQLWWTLGCLALAKIGRLGQGRWWLILGLAGGLGLLTKFSIGFFAVGILVGLLLGPLRGAFTTRWPYLAVLLAVVIGSASLVGQIRLGFPVVVHMQDLQSSQLRLVTFGSFLSGQILMLGPAILLAIAGLVYLLAARSMRSYRAIGWACLVVFLELLLLHGKPYYFGPVYPALLAAGSVALAGMTGPAWRNVRVLMLSAILAWGLLAVPFGLPIVPPLQMAKLAAAVGLKAAVTTNRGTVLPLPQDYADMLGWEDQVRAVAEVYESLSAEQRAQAWLIGRNYGQAGALEFFGPKYGLPPRVLLPQNDRLWPPPADRPCEVVLSVGISREELAYHFRTVRLVAHHDHPWRVEYERNVPICVAQGPTRDLKEAWRLVRR